jgi:MYXO-CTERM domain-containing protein
VSWFDAARFANWVNNGATLGASTETGAYTLNGATSGIFTVNPGATWFLPSEDQWYKAAYYKGGGTNAGYWVYPTQSDTRPGNNIGGTANQANFSGIYVDGYAVTQSEDYSDTQNYLTEAGAFSNSGSAYGTFDQAGNVWEWNDAVIEDGDFFRGLRAGSWEPSGDDLRSSIRAYFDPSDEASFAGFRLATLASEPGPTPIPEPGTWAAAALLAGAAGYVRWRRRRAA